VSAWQRCSRLARHPNASVLVEPGPAFLKLDARFDSWRRHYGECSEDYIKQEVVGSSPTERSAMSRLPVAQLAEHPSQRLRVFCRRLAS
jgi:hypothetical protein